MKEILMYILCAVLALFISAKLTPIILWHFLEPSIEVMVDYEIERQANILVKDSMIKYLSNEKNWN